MSINRHRDRGGWGRDPRNCRHFWTLHPMRVSRVSTVAGIVGVGVAILVIVVALGLSDPLGVSKASTVTGIVVVGVTSLVTIIFFGLSDPLGTPILTGVVGVGIAILATVNAFRSLDPPIQFEKIAIPVTVANLALYMWKSKHSGELSGGRRPLLRYMDDY